MCLQTHLSIDILVFRFLYNLIADWTNRNLNLLVKNVYISVSNISTPKFNKTYLPTLPVLPGVSKFFIKSPSLPVRPPNLPVKSNRGVFFINVVAYVAGVIVGLRLVKFWATAKPHGEWGGGHKGIKQ